MYTIAESMADAIKTIENKTHKEIDFISFYVTGEVKDIAFVVVDIMGASCNSNEPV